MGTRALEKGMFSAIMITSAALLAFGCEWSGGPSDGGRREVLKFELPASRPAAPPPVSGKVADVLPQAEVVDVGIDLSDSVPDLAFEHVDPQPVDHLEVARELIDGGDPAAAMIELGKALYDDPEDYAAAFLLGRTARRSQKIDLATRAFLLAAKIDPQKPAPWLQLARLSLDRKNNDEAEKRIRHALSVEPRLPEAHNLLGRVWLNRSHWHKAIISFEKAVTLSPDNRYYWNNLGYAYLLKRDFQKAVVALEAAVEDGDGSGDASVVPAYIRNNLGLAYEGAGRLQDAIVEFEAALQKQPGYINARINLERNVRLAKAEADVDEVNTDELLIETQPDDGDLILVDPDGQ